MTTSPTFDSVKFKQLVHHVLGRSRATATLSVAALNKVIYYSDFIFYLIHGHAITGETYINGRFGPVPLHITPAIDGLIAERKVVRGKQDYFSRIKAGFAAISSADISGLSSQELSLINEAFDYVCCNNIVRSADKELHSDLWRLAEIGKPIPYFTAFAADVGDINEDDLAWADQELHRLSA